MAKAGGPKRNVPRPDWRMVQGEESLRNRARTAIGRPDLSRPFKCAMGDGLIEPGARILDYGCGRGDDLRRLSALGYDTSGWDPVHRADGVRDRSPVVNLGYVVNVIEDAGERREALLQAWALTDRVLLVSARLSLDGRGLQNCRQYRDGCVTSRGTFQKFFEQQELRNWIDSILGVRSVAAAPGVFYVFRDEQKRAEFASSRYRRRMRAPRLGRLAELFEAHRELLDPLVQFVGERGRIPHEDEVDGAGRIIEVFGSLARAFRVVVTATDKEDWEEVKRERRQDLMVYLALAQFDERARFGRLPESLQRDVRAFFGTYKRACAAADELLFSLGNPGVVDAACKGSRVGKHTPTALYVHESAVSELSPVLRLYEGCASGMMGRVEGANVIKLHRSEAKVSYLAYPEFETRAHPALAWSMIVHLQTFRVKVRDYSLRRNRPILHRKELFVSPKHPAFRKFARLTRIEEGKGLFGESTKIGHEDGWNEILAGKGLCFRGHRLVSAGKKLRSDGRDKVPIGQTNGMD